MRVAAASNCLHGSDAIGEELFRLAARLNTKHVYYQPSLYTNPHHRNGSSVSAIKESFSRSRDTHVRLLKKRRLEERDEQSQEEAPKPKAKSPPKPKAEAAPKPKAEAAPKPKAEAAPKPTSKLLRSLRTPTSAGSCSSLLFYYGCFG